MKSSLRPVAAVEVAVADSLGYVLYRDVGRGVEVGDGAGHLEDTAVGAGREVQSLHSGVEEAGGGGVQGAIFLHHAVGHLCVAVDATDTAAGDGRGILEALALDGAGGGHALADDAAWFAALQVAQLGDGHGGHLHLYIYTIGYYIVRFSC